MKEEHKLSHIIKEGFQDMFYIWKDELKQVFRDEGIMIFFFLVPLVYPVLYAYIYNNEVVHEAKMVVVDQSNSPLSREFIRRVDASSEVHVVQVVCRFLLHSARICIRDGRQPFPCTAI